MYYGFGFLKFENKSIKTTTYVQGEADALPLVYWTPLTHVNTCTDKTKINANIIIFYSQHLFSSADPTCRWVKFQIEHLEKKSQKS